MAGKLVTGAVIAAFALIAVSVLCRDSAAFPKVDAASGGKSAAAPAAGPKTPAEVRKAMANVGQAFQPVKGGRREAAAPDAGVRTFGKSLVEDLLALVIYSVLGLIVLLVGFKALDFMTPFSLNKEIAEDNNTAAGVVVAGMMIALGIIIAAAIMR